MTLDIQPATRSLPDIEPDLGRAAGGPVLPAAPWVRRSASQLGVIAIFTVPGIFLWWHAWAGSPGSTVRCNCLDPAQQVWFIAWPAYAISHGLDPFFTNWLWPPHGVNLLNNASGSLIGIVMSPVTWLVGPFAATTLALTLAPGLSAWGCWIACRRFTTWKPAAWIGGFLFGYSPFVVDSLGQGHLSVALLVVPPLIIAVLHETLVRQARSPVWCGTALGLLVAVQFLISSEVLLVTTIAAAVGLVLAAVLSPTRVALAGPFALRALAIGAVVAIVLLLIPVWEMLKGPEHIKGGLWSGAQQLFTAHLYSLWNPGLTDSLLWPGALVGPSAEYLGFGMIVVWALSIALSARRRSAWVIAGTGVVATVFSWGGWIWFSPHHFVVSSLLPWGHLVNLPILENLSPKSFMLIGQLAVAVGIAIGLDAMRRSKLGERLGRTGRTAAIALVIGVTALPVWLTYAAPLSVETVNLPPWYATVGKHVPEGSVVTSFPFPASASDTSVPMVWQAADGMRFRLAGGYIKVPAPHGGHGVLAQGPPNSATRVLDQLTFHGIGFNLTAPALIQLRAALVQWHTRYIVVSRWGLAVTASAMFTAATHQLPSVSHDAWVWDLRTHPMSGGYNASASLAAFTDCTNAYRPAAGLSDPVPQSVNLCVLALV